MAPASDLWRRIFLHFTYLAHEADITFEGIHMKFSGWRNWLATLAVSLVTVLPAQANLVTFEDVTPTLFQGSSIDSGIYRFTSDGLGFSGVDNAASFFASGNAPGNASGQFLFALNNDGITMERIDGTAFDLQSFSATFIAPLGGIGAGVFAGELVIVGSDANGFDFVFFAFAPSDDNGNFNFETVALTGRYFVTAGCGFTTPAPSVEPNTRSRISTVKPPS